MRTCVTWNLWQQGFIYYNSLLTILISSIPRPNKDLWSPQNRQVDILQYVKWHAVTLEYNTNNKEYMMYFQCWCCEKLQGQWTKDALSHAISCSTGIFLWRVLTPCMCATTVWSKYQTVMRPWDSESWAFRKFSVSYYFDLMIYLFKKMAGSKCNTPCDNANDCRLVKRIFMRAIWGTNFSPAEQSKYYSWLADNTSSSKLKAVKNIKTSHLFFLFFLRVYQSTPGSIDMHSFSMK